MASDSRLSPTSRAVKPFENRGNQETLAAPYPESRPGIVGVIKDAADLPSRDQIYSIVAGGFGVTS
jgi:hypothetical protein